MALEAKAMLMGEMERDLSVTTNLIQLCNMSCWISQRFNPRTGDTHNFFILKYC